MTALMTQNQTLGRGKLMFSTFTDTVNQKPAGFRYLGNSPAFSFTFGTQNLDHFSSDSGVKEKDNSIIMQVDRTATFTLDNINRENLALYFLGSSQTLTATSTTVNAELVSAVIPGLIYPLGLSAATPSGVRGLVPFAAGPPAANVTVTNDAASNPPTYVEGVDYKVHMPTGAIEVLTGGSIAAGTNLKVSYKIGAAARDQVLSSNQIVAGAMRYVAENPAGANFDFYAPSVKVSPDGEYNLKGDTWQEIKFKAELLVPIAGGSAVYIDGRANA